MNFLAHAHLSFNQPGILTGNMISDFVKGKKKFDFPPLIQRGIALHRAIDEFTDFHPVTQNAKMFFRKDYRLYSGAFIDVVYDHFLANDKNEFPTDAALNSFCQTTYTRLQDDKAVLPERFAQMLPYMQQQNWLYHYKFSEGIEKGFGGLVKRAAYISDSATAYKIFKEHYAELGECYQLFFPALKNFAFHHLSHPDNS